MLSKKNLMVSMVTDEFLINHIILQKSVATTGFIWFFWFQKCILLYIFVQVFLVMKCIRSHISFFMFGLTPTLKCMMGNKEKKVELSFYKLINRWACLQNEWMKKSVCKVACSTNAADVVRLIKARHGHLHLCSHMCGITFMWGYSKASQFPPFGDDWSYRLSLQHINVTV